MENKDSEEIAQAINSVHQEPHPYVTPEIFQQYNMRTVSFVGRVKEVKQCEKSTKLVLQRSDSKPTKFINYRQN